MAQCKKDCCRAQAVYHRRWGHKRYCEEHGHAYADKRDAALRAREKMPDCTSGISPSCEGKVGAQRAARGETVCRFCEEEARELHERYVYEERRQRAEEIKLWRLDQCDTVEELKEWIKEYVT